MRLICMELLNNKTQVLERQGEGENKFLIQNSNSKTQLAVSIHSYWDRITKSPPEMLTLASKNYHHDFP